MHLKSKLNNVKQLIRKQIRFILVKRTKKKRKQMARLQKNIILISIICFQFMYIKADQCNLSIDQLNNQIIYPIMENCSKQLCFYGNTTLTIQYESIRINSITLKATNKTSQLTQLVLKTPPSQNLLTINSQFLVNITDQYSQGSYSFINLLQNQTTKWIVNI
ncbi:transmembrane protein, putative (macronuclear) [Tetrahymena thermophila SB210]|uniref:Transmembrane protein, putative n=1 Tax=Tetrahymena thermophila (strain SB210) TaxID=312017 RepID=W7XB15_TETTS|nr:transmembrane protein, putative [Tetrahymena thermophila SB210]EWS74532.1 transmembrane protein, putative [Tetrahymena thermophila SB210]|eukprot:XP_012652906.1 transmembrane protein, putative [Tetrahymena thermophila SB210]